MVFLIVLPFLGALIYLIAQHDGMAERSAKSAQGQRQEFDEYVKKVAADGDPASQIEKAKQLRDNGTIDQAEFEALKAKALQGPEGRAAAWSGRCWGRTSDLLLVRQAL